MKTSDPAGYDQFRQITVADALVEECFKAILLCPTSTTASSVTVNVFQIINGNINTKELTIKTAANTNLIFPISGVSIEITSISANTNCYILI